MAELIIFIGLVAFIVAIAKPIMKDVLNDTAVPQTLEDWEKETYG